MSVFPPLTIEVDSDMVYKPIFDRDSSVTLDSEFMPQFWIALFFILLAVAQLYQSIKDINLPFPVYLVLGTVLAVASNSQSQFSFSQDRQVRRQESQEADLVLDSVQSPTVTVTDDRPKHQTSS
jgi:hypothetical protein